MDYYATAKTASQQISGHPGLEFLRAKIQPEMRILDVGCGEGTRLQTLTAGRPGGFGIDVNPAAVRLAKRRYPGHRFLVGRAEQLPFRRNSFDLVYTAFAIEHCQFPEKFLTEMLRVVRPGGRIVVLAPNFGAPNRRSPVSLTSPATKLVQGLIKDLWPPPALDWEQVVPKDTYENIDDDTTFEPYVGSLIRFLRRRGLQIEIASSLWELEPPPQKLHHRLFLALGKSGLPPFRFWGPQLFVSALK
jgi:ubiquinone/menaquinone biosynthesis C-methylase UbiE